MKEFPFIESNTGMNGIVMRNVGFVNGDAFCDVVPCPIWHACMFLNTRYAVVPAIRTSDIWWAGEARGVGFVFAAGSWGKEEEEETKNERHDRCWKMELRRKWSLGFWRGWGRGKCWTKLPRCVEKNYARGEDVGIFFLIYWNYDNSKCFLCKIYNWNSWSKVSKPQCSFWAPFRLFIDDSREDSSN